MRLRDKVALITGARFGKEMRRQPLPVTVDPTAIAQAAKKEKR
ncbi:MAG: hypothetical protein OXH50_04495 [Gemmatimonadetes bacterium]|nr:hypothetical protein [Gemmatimonadota bacterium]